ncbi:MAG TPA: hypothetical protein P5080_03920 [Candidatus Paceibacterota bacterium]|nr:hypothetical protein [Candidatus Pacearchaeota archaeon]HRZ51170.1 hypothetical protein [Candidatus Paceibacterota bacterium]HSA36823.1 hypothetical protein [Candidatus Paceibacterota bacterium]
MIKTPRPDGETDIKSVRYDASRVNGNENMVRYYFMIAITDGSMVLVKGQDKLDDVHIDPAVKEMVREIYEIDGVGWLRLERDFIEVNAPMAVDWIKVNLHACIAEVLNRRLYNDRADHVFLIRGCGFIA